MAAYHRRWENGSWVVWLVGLEREAKGVYGKDGKKGQKSLGGPYSFIHIANLLLALRIRRGGVIGLELAIN